MTLDPRALREQARAVATRQAEEARLARLDRERQAEEALVREAEIFARGVRRDLEDRLPKAAAAGQMTVKIEYNTYPHDKTYKARVRAFQNVADHFKSLGFAAAVREHYSDGGSGSDPGPEMRWVELAVSFSG